MECNEPCCECTERRTRRLALTGDGHLRQMRVAAAERCFCGALQFEPRCLLALNGLGNVLVNRGDYRRAVPMFQLALEANPRNGEALNNLGYVSFLRKNYSAAARLFRQGLRLATREPEYLWNNLGLALQKLGEHRAALEAFENALNMKATFSDAHYNRGNALLALGQMSQAVEAWRKCVAYNSTYWRAWYNIGVGEYLAGGVGAATECWERVLRLQPYHKDAAHNLSIAKTVAMKEQGERWKQEGRIDMKALSD